MTPVSMAGKAMLKATTALAVAAVFIPGSAWGIANETDLRNAIFTANDTGGTQTITLTGNVTLTQSLPMITDSLTFVGGGFTIDANNTGRVFFAQNGTLAVSNVTINNARAQGGAGGDSNVGAAGGGGLGAGAAIFVNATAAVTATNVVIGNAAALGGDGGDGSNTNVGAGGGGLGGNGGFQSSLSGSGGGGYDGDGGGDDGSFGGGGGGEFGDGSTANDGSSRAGGGGGRQLDGAANAGGGTEGGDGSGGAGQTGQNAQALGGGGGGGGREVIGASNGGGGLVGGGGGGGGYDNGNAAANVDGGDGGDFAGGGGSGLRPGTASAQGGNGGFGGGGGGIEGGGGFGGGGGAGRSNGGTGGTFGGNGGTNGAGGGGAALGGAVFVRDGGHLTLQGVTFSGSYSITAGAAGTGAAAGLAAGSGQALGQLMFLHGNSTVTIGSGTSLTGTADTYVAGGTLVVNGTLGAITVASAGTLGGTGTVGAVTANGRIAPGNSIGTLVTGDVNFNSGSVLAVEIDPSGNADLIDSSGTVTINGGSRVEVTPQAGEYADGLTYTLIDADGGVVGTFGSVGYAAGQSILFDLSLLYTANQIRLRLDRNSQDFAGLVQDPLLAGTGAALDELETLIPTGDPLLQGFYGLNSTDVLNDGINQVSGSGLGAGSTPALGASQAALTSLIGMTGGAGPSSGGFAMAPASDLRTRQVAAEGLSLSDLLAMTDPVSAETGSEDTPGPALFLESFGGFGSRDGSALIDDTDHWYAGALGGVVWPLDERFTVSAGIGYAAGRSGSEDGRQSTDTDTVLAIGHGQWSQDGWRIDGSVGFARHALSSERKLSIGTFAATADGDRAGYELFADIGVGHTFEMDNWSLRPEAGIGLSWLIEEDWSESGAGAANLSVDAADTVTAQPRIGLGVGYDWALSDTLTLTPNANALWLGRFGTSAEDTYRARFTNGTSAWDVPNLEAPTHTAAVGAGVTLTDRNAWALRADYTGRFSADSVDHGFVLGGEVRF